MCADLHVTYIVEYVSTNIKPKVTQVKTSGYLLVNKGLFILNRSGKQQA